MPHMVTFDGLKFSGVNRANPNDSPGPSHDTGATGENTQQNSQAIVWPSYQPEADGFMRLDDIKGEFSPSREVDGISNQTAQLRDGAVHQDMPMDTHPNDNLLGSRELHDSLHCIVGGTMCSAVSKDADALVQQGNDFAGLINPDSMRPVDFIAQDNSGMSGTAQEWFSLGRAVDSVASEGVLVKTYCTGYCVDGGSSEQENVFAPANMQLRSDNRF